MKLEQNSKYILRFEVNHKELVFVATIDEDDGMLITFTDKYNKKITFNKSKLISAEEIGQNGN